MNELVEWLNALVWSSGIPIGGHTIPFVVIALLGTGLFLTLRLGFVQFTRLAHGVNVASGRYDDPDHPGDVSHFQALSTALSATVGIGNIAGVALAIHWGGPGALFWMWVTALLGMATKFAEVTLAQKYRIVEAGAAETVSGGPMYYIERGLGPSWRPLALFFAVALGFTAFLTGNGVQANTLADTLRSFGVDPWITGVVSAALVGAVILGGVQRIGKVAAVLAPAMAAIYVAAGLVVLALHIELIVPTLALVVREAFQPSAGVAGTGVGAVLVTAMWGVRRGLFSNEAGQGSAPIAHAAAKTNEPVSEGVVALLEPFIDTIIICTMTALVIVMTGADRERVPTAFELGSSELAWVSDAGDGPPPGARHEDVIVVQAGLVTTHKPVWNDVVVETLYTDLALTQPFSGSLAPLEGIARSPEGSTHEVLYGPAVESGAPLTMLAFERGLAPLVPGGRYVVVLCVVLFAVSTAISWSYYGDRCAHYVLGTRAVLPYRVVYTGMHFLGAIAPLSLAWTIGDIALGVVIVPNLIALVLLSSQVKRELDSYFERRPWVRRGT